MQTAGADVLIGTHRILSKDIRFKDLGLLVIDEEQRFGVQHKEAIKYLKKNVGRFDTVSHPDSPYASYVSFGNSQYEHFG